MTHEPKLPAHDLGISLRSRKLICGERTRCTVLSRLEDAETIIRCFVHAGADNYFVKSWGDKPVVAWLETVLSEWRMPTFPDVVAATVPPAWSRELWIQEIKQTIDPEGRDEAWAERYLGFMVSGFLPLKYPRTVKGKGVAFTSDPVRGVVSLNVWSRAHGVPMLILAGKGAAVDAVEDESRTTGKALGFSLANAQLSGPVAFEAHRPLPIRRYITDQPRSFFES